ncbi:MAG TPA: FliM/FliN family flagellar motor C-terminal domain-containing protein [Acidobacteriota bacterium]|nr:FliM/FliN family flagellar motor C-terminal domain-containing protein [Acidobacteriota bacterium]HRR27621.1 FliM/FliN family flagellar motor C-terminal domain-containing protein [Acidobacteriota bacterium]HRV08157.1 FliM/FliN family flagellar motor C-terminal domain-containing protein [Acidobacteriota bacterium]
MNKILISQKELDHIIDESAGDLKRFLDLEFPIDVRMGSAVVMVGDLLKMAPGDVLVLDRPSSGYVEIWAAGVKIGEAEVLVRKKGTAARVVRLVD